MADTVIEVLVAGAGPRGPAGPTGPASGVFAVELFQTVPASTWIFTVPPLFGRRPTVTLYTTAGVIFEADVSASSTQVTITLSSPLAGSAVLS